MPSLYWREFHIDPFERMKVSIIQIQILQYNFLISHFHIRSQPFFTAFVTTFVKQFNRIPELTGPPLYRRQYSWHPV